MAEQLKAKSEAARVAAEQTTAPGKKAALEYIAEHPRATQAEVAEAAGVTQAAISQTGSTYIFGTSSENITQASRAKANGITDRTQRKLDKLERNHPDLWGRVREGYTDAVVPIVDVWMSYKALKDTGWTQDEIAEAKGVGQTIVAYRLQCSRLPQYILDKFINSDNLNERHALELLKLSTVDKFAPWLTRESAMFRPPAWGYPCFVIPSSAHPIDLWLTL